MKPTVKVSIGGMAFNLEEEAYRILDNYLKALRKHFESNPESEEIIADIEIRLSELLQMRVNNAEMVVSVTDAQEIIKIMGNPKDFDDNENVAETPINNNKEKEEKVNQEHYKKKLYRDEDNKMIGGVFSGLGNYFNIDPTILRFGIIALLLIFNFLTFKVAVTLVIAYLVLWAVTPAAKTFSQKLAMSGADPSISNIEDRTQSASLRRKKSSGFVGILINIVVGFIAVITFIILLSVILVLGWLYFDTDIVGLNNYLLLVGYNTLNFKVAIALACLIPLFGMFCLMVKILRRTPFTINTLVSVTICLIFWFGSIFYLGNNGVKFARNYNTDAIVTEVLSDTISYNTLRIKLPDDSSVAYKQPNNDRILYKGEKMKYRQMQILPTVKVREDSTLSDYKIEIRKRARGRSYDIAKRNAENMRLKYNRTDSTLVIEPEWYGRNNPWNLDEYDMIITAPKGKKVIVESPLKDRYHVDMNFNINRKNFRKYDYRNHRHHFYFD